MKKMPGPPPKPTSILKLSGSPLADKRKCEPTPPADAPEVPPWLNKRQREGWDWLVGALAKMGLLSSADMPVIASFAVSWGAFVEAVENIEIDGSTCEGSAGNLVPSPWVKIRNEASGQILRFAQQFGLSPAARARVRVAEGKAKEDGKARFFKAG